MKDSVKCFKDGREICLPNAAGKREYKRRLAVMVERQERTCALCANWMVHPTFDHESGRGVGGSRRDDRIEVNGKRQNAAVCWTCNGNKGSKRVPYLFQ